MKLKTLKPSTIPSLMYFEALIKESYIEKERERVRERERETDRERERERERD